MHDSSNNLSRSSFWSTSGGGISDLKLFLNVLELEERIESRVERSFHLEHLESEKRKNPKRFVRISLKSNEREKERNEDESTLGTCRRNVSININNTAFWQERERRGRGGRLREKEAYRGRWSLIEFKIHANSWIMRPLGALERLSCGEGSRHKGASRRFHPICVFNFEPLFSRRKCSSFSPFFSFPLPLPSLNREPYSNTFSLLSFDDDDDNINRILIIFLNERFLD